MFFDKDNYRVESVESEGGIFYYRAYRDIVFADKPIKDFHRMNIYIPEVYYDGHSINGYTLNTAPIFMPNAVGGYFPAKQEEPGERNTIRQALIHGYVVVSPALRGRTLKDENGKNYGKAPACIVDYKAAVRYLHRFANEIPGDDKKIITNGTSAGGALSCLVAVTANHPDYEEYLKEIGVSEGDDSVLAASCYCPIINLDHSDMAYEWQFDGIYDYHRSKMQMSEGGRPYFTPDDGVMDDTRIRISGEESTLFPEYLNSLNLKSENGERLTLDENGNGSFKEYVKSVILSSAQTALNSRELPSIIPYTEMMKWCRNVKEMDFDVIAEEIIKAENLPSCRYDKDEVVMSAQEAEELAKRVKEEERQSLRELGIDEDLWSPWLKENGKEWIK